VLTASEKAEQTARLALDVAKAALDAAQKKDPADPALKQSLTAAISAIPSPWHVGKEGQRQRLLVILRYSEGSGSRAEEPDASEYLSMTDGFAVPLRAFVPSAFAFSLPPFPMPELRPDQLESIRRLLLEPLRDAVRAELELSHERLAGAIESLAQRVADYTQRIDRRLGVVERETMRLRNFRRRVVAIYGAGAFVVTLLWSLVREKLLSKLGGR
jgi:hypothetical protein